MITTIRTFTRPSTSVDWWHDTAANSLEFNQRLHRDFISTGKILSRDIENDGMTIVVTIKWASQADMDAHYKDKMNSEYFKRRDSYNDANGITTTFNEVK